MVQVSILINDHYNDVHYNSSYVEFIDIYQPHVLQRTQLSSMGRRVQVCYVAKHNDLIKQVYVTMISSMNDYKHRGH